jgi:hypothetical protein
MVPEAELIDRPGGSPVALYVTTSPSGSDPDTVSEIEVFSALV